jgi:hypothetical protein
MWYQRWLKSRTGQATGGAGFTARSLAERHILYQFYGLYGLGAISRCVGLRSNERQRFLLQS